MATNRDREALAGAVARSARGKKNQREHDHEQELTPKPDIVVEPEEARPDPLAAVTSGSAADLRAASESAADHISELQRFKLDVVAPHPFNPPERLLLDDELRALGENIRERGLRQPIVLAPRARIEQDDPAAAVQLPAGARWVIIMGHRRYAASLDAGVQQLPGLTYLGPGDPVTIAEVFWDENFQRKTPSPLMEAQQFRRMQESGLSTTQIGERVGISQPQVSRTLKLLQLETVEGAPREMHQGRLTRTDAYALLGLSEEDRAKVFTAWQNDQDRAEGDETHEPRNLKHWATRYTQPAAAAVPNQSAQPARSKQGSRKAAPARRSGGDVPLDAVIAVMNLELSPTDRADILSDAYLHASAAPRAWTRTSTAAVLNLSEKEAREPDVLPQAQRRKVGIARALLDLENARARAGTGDGEGKYPPYLERHVERLKRLGVLD